MQKLVALLALFLCLGSTAFSSVSKEEASGSLKSLSHESKQSLKKLILMNGRLEQRCEDHDPDACLSTSVKRSPTQSQKHDANDSITISTASIDTSARQSAEGSEAKLLSNQEQEQRLGSGSTAAVATSLLATPDVLSDTERKELIRQLAADCKANNAPACTRLAKISAEMKKHRTSMQLYKRACELGESRICHELGNRLEKSGKQDLAELYFSKACTQGDKSACRQKN